MYEYFWISYFCCLLIPILALIAGYTMLKYTPTHLNSLIALRTTRAMRDGKTWKFANERAGTLLCRTSWAMLAISAAVPFFFMRGNDATFRALTLVLCIVQVGCIAFSLIAAQIALMRAFPGREK